jgi:hypothetical protein
MSPAIPFDFARQKLEARGEAMPSGSSSPAAAFALPEYAFLSASH